MTDLKKADAKAFETAWKSIREDGSYIDAGENDNLIVQKLEANPQAVGIFGYSFLEENTSKIKGASVNGGEPTYENIASGKYAVSRPLFVYVKKQHVGVVPGVDKFVEEYVSDKAIGEDGYLSAKGLVPLPAEERAKVADAAKSMQTMGAEAF
jgi:phosphate transport system substrate-binding protein